MLLFAGLSIAVGIGLLNLHNWARVLSIALSALAAALVGLGMLSSLLAFEILSLMFQAVLLAIYAAIVWYLMQPDVKRAFGTTA